MKKFLLTGGLVIWISLSMAQQKITAVSSPAGPAIEHTVVAGEGLYSLSRKYHVNVNELASANGYDKDKNLILNQKIKIPLSADNFNQKSKKGIPVHYTVGEKEGLMTVSNKFRKVALKNLRDWNGLKKDQLNKGQTLIVGYLVPPEGEAKTEAAGVKDEKLASVASKTEKAEKTDKSGKTSKTDKKETAKKSTDTQKSQDKTVNAKKPEPAPVPEAAPEKAAVSDQKVEQIVSEKIAAHQEAQVIKEEPLDETGFFKRAWNAGSHASPGIEKKITSGIFKTNKGWSDKKYYALIDDVEPGKVVKIQNPETGTLIYARVLGSISDLKQSGDLKMRISDATAVALKIANKDRFDLSVSE
jgi:LysM repeat protein